MANLSVEERMRKFSLHFKKSSLLIELTTGSQNTPKLDHHSLLVQDLLGDR